MARFTVLQHIVPPASDREDHFDLLLEDANVLLTWEFLSWPPNETQTQLVRRLPDHRKEYLEFEGKLTRKRGHVVRVASGEFEFRSKTDRHWAVDVSGSHFRGVLHFHLIENDSNPANDDAQRWKASVEPA